MAISRPFNDLVGPWTFAVKNSVPTFSFVLIVSRRSFVPYVGRCGLIAREERLARVTESPSLRRILSLSPSATSERVACSIRV